MLALPPGFSALYTRTCPRFPQLATQIPVLPWKPPVSGRSERCSTSRTAHRCMAHDQHHHALTETSPKNTDAPFQAYIENLPVMFYAVTPRPPHRPLYISPSFEAFCYPIQDWLNDPEIWDRI